MNIRKFNKIGVLLKRNAANDTVKDGIDYKGYDFCWPDGSPTSVSFAQFCSVGMRTVFGKAGPTGERHHVDLFFQPCDENDSLALVPKGVKVRRLYLIKEGDYATFHLHNGVVTELVFRADDDPRVTAWMEFHALREGEKQWFDFWAELKPTGVVHEASVNMLPRNVLR
jgi:hypothetical protein